MAREVPRSIANEFVACQNMPSIEWDCRVHEATGALSTALNRDANMLVVLLIVRPVMMTCTLLVVNRRLQ